MLVPSLSKKFNVKEMLTSITNLDGKFSELGLQDRLFLALLRFVLSSTATTSVILISLGSMVSVNCSVHVAVARHACFLLAT